MMRKVFCTIVILESWRDKRERDRVTVREGVDGNSHFVARHGVMTDLDSQLEPFMIPSTYIIPLALALTN
jgi:hypothetical protein